MTVEPEDHYVVINDRRWRATDPLIPEAAAAVLRKQLMRARRAVRSALQADDQTALRAARDEVQRNKVALGERGTPPWWEQSDQERTSRWEAALPDTSD